MRILNPELHGLGSRVKGAGFGCYVRCLEDVGVKVGPCGMQATNASQSNSKTLNPKPLTPESETSKP